MIDVQKEQPRHSIALCNVGVRNVAYPVRLTDEIEVRGLWTMAGKLGADVRGTHMSRFLEALSLSRGNQEPKIMIGLATMTKLMLEAEEVTVTASFHFFVDKQAPESELVFPIEYNGYTEVNALDGEKYIYTIGVIIPITTCCPCSKAISDHGAHSQRAQIRVAIDQDFNGDNVLSHVELVDLLEDSGSAEVYGILKRPDEKIVTEKAYENAKFVEDVVREVAHRLIAEPRVLGFRATVLSDESIHDHEAFAELTWERPAPASEE